MQNTSLNKNSLLKIRPKILLGDCLVNKVLKSEDKIKMFFDRSSPLNISGQVVSQLGQGQACTSFSLFYYFVFLLLSTFTCNAITSVFTNVIVTFKIVFSH